MWTVSFVSVTAKGSEAMSLVRFFGRWQEQAALVDASGRWARWVECQPGLEVAESAVGLGRMAADRTDPARANDLLLALVRVGSVDGGVDELAVTFLASLLVPGGDRLARSLWSLGGDVEQIIAGQLWLQLREYPWRTRPRAVAKNTLMETRRSVLADFGAATATRAALVPLPPVELAQTLERHVDVAPVEPPADLALLDLLVWARSRQVLTADAATLLWDLAVLAAEETQRTGRAGRARGVGSLQAATQVAQSRGLATRSVRRQRDRALSALRLVQADYRGDAPELGEQLGAVPSRVGSPVGGRS